VFAERRKDESSSLSDLRKEQPIKPTQITSNIAIVTCATGTGAPSELKLSVLSARGRSLATKKHATTTSNSQSARFCHRKVRTGAARRTTNKATTAVRSAPVASIQTTSPVALTNSTASSITLPAVLPNLR
jgi:hypothetical protein